MRYGRQGHIRCCGRQNLMAPEAYTLKAALDGWIGNENGEQVRERAAVAYDKYQKCGMRGARRLFATGW